MSLLPSPDFSDPGLPCVEYPVTTNAKFYDVAKTEADVVLLKLYITLLIQFAHERRPVTEFDTEQTRLHSASEGVKYQIISEPAATPPYFDIRVAYPLTFEYTAWHTSQLLGLRIGKVDNMHVKMYWEPKFERNALMVRVLAEPHYVARKYRFISMEEEPTFYTMGVSQPIGGRGVKRTAEGTPSKKARIIKPET